ncbi:MAG: DNA polymerase III subunit delta [Bacteroidales bacterium]|nr:DNA polymerase III subunit delta [Bacteroidales bacterium]
MMAFDDIMRELKASKFRPIYLLMGEEPYYIDVISSYIEKHALNDCDRDFNQTIFYGKDAKVRDIIHEADQYPMMAERRLVILREAQELNTAASAGGDRDHFQDFAHYAEHIQPSTILVICYKYGKVDGRSKLIKAIEKADGVVFDSPKLWDNQVPSWITSYVTSQGLSIDQSASELLAEFIGTKLTNVVSAIEKLKLVCEGEQKRNITVDLVTKHVGASNEYNTLELRSALFNRNVPKVNRIVKAFAGNDKQYPVQMVISVLFGSFQKLFAYHYLPDKRTQAAAQAMGEKPFVIQTTYEVGARNYSARKCLEIIDILRDYDMKSKGYQWPSISSGDALREMIFRIMN